MNCTESQRVGIMASDPLRALGLQSILEDAGMKAFLLPPMAIDSIGHVPRSDLAALLLDARTSDAASGETLLETIIRLRKEQPAMKIVVMDTLLDPHHVQSIIAAGAKGYLVETAGENEIRMALEVVLDGSIWAPRKVLARLIEQGGGTTDIVPAEPVAGKMSRRELEVLELLLRGRSNRDIAGSLGIDEVTVKAHLGRMLRKTSSNNRVELTLKALEERKTTRL